MRYAAILISALSFPGLLACGGGSSPKSAAPIAVKQSSSDQTTSSSTGSSGSSDTLPKTNGTSPSTDPVTTTVTVTTQPATENPATGSTTTAGGTTTVTTPPVVTSYDFASVTELVFKPHCYSCHSTGVRNLSGLYFDSYQNVKLAISRIKTEAVVNRTMPQTGPLTDDVRAILANWIDGGYPEKH